MMLGLPAGATAGVDLARRAVGGAFRFRAPPVREGTGMRVVMIGADPVLDGGELRSGVGARED
jgi:hypothetical protein